MLAAAARRRYVSRGGDKLDTALTRLGVDVTGEDVLDLGASTGGFVDRLLQGGAARVIAVDVGYGQLDWKLREDPRVTVLERTNARQLTAERLPFEPSFVTADLSFISLTVALEPVLECLRAGYRGLVLVKPQFEAGRERVGKGGVVRDPAVHRDVLDQVAGWLQARGATVLGVCDSGHPGPKGNVEYFILFSDATHRRSGSAAGDRPRARRGGGGSWVSPCAASRCSRTTSPRRRRPRWPSSPRPRAGWGSSSSCRRTRRPSTPPPPAWATGPSTRPACAPRTSASCSAATAPSCAASRASSGRACPRSGVNYGNVGFLASLPRDGWEAGLETILGGDYRVVELLTVDVLLGGEHYSAVNDVILSRVAPRHVLQLEYEVAGVTVGSMFCDGLIIASPTGSTAYNLSCNGPIVEWNAGVLVLNFIAPHSLGFRPVILRPDHVITARNVSPLQECEVVADGDVVGRLCCGDDVRVTAGREVARLLMQSEGSFYQNVEEKLFDRRDAR